MKENKKIIRNFSSDLKESIEQILLRINNILSKLILRSFGNYLDLPGTKLYRNKYILPVLTQMKINQKLVDKLFKAKDSDRKTQRIFYQHQKKVVNVKIFF
jgi:hypothetical protein